MSSVDRDHTLAGGCVLAAVVLAAALMAQGLLGSARPVRALE